MPMLKEREKERGEERERERKGEKEKEKEKERGGDTINEARAGEEHSSWVSRSLHYMRERNVRLCFPSFPSDQGKRPSQKRTYKAMMSRTNRLLRNRKESGEYWSIPPPPVACHDPSIRSFNNNQHKKIRYLNG